MDSTSQTATESKGFYKLSAIQRIGFGSGDLAQNLIYQTVSMYLLIFYTNVFGISAAAAGVMFLIVRIVDVIWDPIVGAFVDKHNPKLGKYRSYLVLGGIPLTGFAILCFWNGFSGSLVYAYITYVGLSMCYTLINVPYGALNASLTRDTDEITKLTSTRMFLANLGGLAVAYGIPIIVKALSPDGKINSPEAGNAWFITMTIYAIVGLALLIFCYTQTKERVVMDEKETEDVKVSDLWMEFKHNRPLRILAFFFITAFAMMAIGNSAGSYYMIYNVQSPDMLPYFMALGSIPAFIFMPMVPAIKRKIGKKRMFYVFLSVAIAGMALLYAISVIPALKTQVWLVFVAQFIKSTGIIVATGYMWALVPEVISYGEHTTGKRISGIVNALTGIFYKAGMALGGVVPGLVLAFVGFDKDNQVTQSAFAEQGILWLVAVIPAILLVLAMFIISRYELEDDVIDKINKEIEERHMKG
ncbi:GPH family glycoside/pentoside/hexuronide:cation symporter [Dysgonomonas sp. PFB1-18]|uniref:MFS transporter n=1 Tax=unclassified Dysgonomonas TaxID=2630389 RepID=UPI002476E8B8|nr:MULTISPECIES: MFS transporter [unclassified Dysgonomonas]MDH6309932.1 GPH family glycoside/pentoside/hexuronide:cation symporter [Dysgonomonas sp. PF1-14]MDH6339475.1 GPH family glycoside/pentoside/hexuronide:cation symporter [Dysgonomonas sp. PF1-16]MDH6380976.1 GPH family glycoside/pentoside/hexuronide:cation symporter [Dysgonomonas sp. PFB1-18]MDH6397985.1 GPH family glycoside/pentoside/hexuronide:cation symporter [Dysgonomonas sp. PF1-23]